MGSLITSKKKQTAKKTFSAGKTIVHKAKVLSPADVEANRSTAYTYLAL